MNYNFRIIILNYAWPWAESPNQCRAPEDPNGALPMALTLNEANAHCLLFPAGIKTRLYPYSENTPLNNSQMIADQQRCYSQITDSTRDFSELSPRRVVSNNNYKPMKKPRGGRERPDKIYLPPHSAAAKTFAGLAVITQQETIPRSAPLVPPKEWLAPIVIPTQEPSGQRRPEKKHSKIIMIDASLFDEEEEEGSKTGPLRRRAHVRRRLGHSRVYSDDFTVSPQLTPLMMNFPLPPETETPFSSRDASPPSPSIYSIEDSPLRDFVDGRLSRYDDWDLGIHLRSRSSYMEDDNTISPLKREASLDSLASAVRRTKKARLERTTTLEVSKLLQKRLRAARSATLDAFSDSDDDEEEVVMVNKRQMSEEEHREWTRWLIEGSVEG